MEFYGGKSDDAHVAESVDDATFDGIYTAVSAFDKHDMRRMGKKQEFRRNFRFISTIGYTTCVMGTWEILLT